MKMRQSEIKHYFFLLATLWSLWVPSSVESSSVNKTSIVSWANHLADRSYYSNVTTVLRCRSVFVNGSIVTPPMIQDKASINYRSLRNSLVVAMQVIYNEAKLACTLVDVKEIQFNYSTGFYEMSLCSYISSRDPITASLIGPKLENATQILFLEGFFDDLFGKITVEITGIVIIMEPSMFTWLQTAVGVGIFSTVIVLLFFMAVGFGFRFYYSKRHELRRKQMMTMTTATGHRIHGNHSSHLNHSGFNNRAFTHDDNHDDFMPTTIAWN